MIGFLLANWILTSGSIKPGIQRDIRFITHASAMIHRTCTVVVQLGSGLILPELLRDKLSAGSYVAGARVYSVLHDLLKPRSGHAFLVKKDTLCP